MTPAPPDLATLALALSFLLAAYLTYCSLTPPNPNPVGSTAALPEDVVAPGPGIIQARRLMPIILWVPHVLLTLCYPSHTAVLCPNSDNLSSSLFTWSPYTTVLVVVIVVAAPIRLLAFRQLGQNFTFRLARPNELIQTGIYAYVQHPSYAAHWLILVSNIALFLRLDGVLGCALPGWAVRWGMGSRGIGIWPALLAWLGLMGLYAIRIRTKDEETMLKKEFGREWEKYHRRTKRYIPGIF
jgi:protein-S-isoprenylcysteine O-methyltransferase Ste14